MPGSFGKVTLATGLSVLAQAALAQTPKLDELPAAIKPAAGLSVYVEALATGAQVYVCAKNSAGAWAWTLKAPDAQLLDVEKKPIGKHYGGPTWEGNDGGKVVGAAKASAPAPNDNGIPWLLLDVKSREGTGLLSQAQAVLRVSTAGGLPPTMACDEGHAGEENRAPYTATYLFLK